MQKLVQISILATALATAPCAVSVAKAAEVLTGQQAFTDYTKEAPGVRRKITVADLPKPYASESASNSPKVVAKPEGAWPKVPSGFKVSLYAEKLDGPRKIVKAPNGDLFVAESFAGKVRVFRGVDANGKPKQSSVFATGLKQPYGIAFYPTGNNPKWVYVANTGSIVRYAYSAGDTEAKGDAETIVAELPAGGGHWTRDIGFSPDSKKLYVAVGSGSNVDDPDTHPRETHRANVLEYTPEGKFVKVYAYGIRNPAGIAVQPRTGTVWVSVNERDQLGDNLVPDYITHVEEGGFYGWPWYYMGDHQDPRHEGKHPELKSKVIVPDVLLHPHNASLGFIFYESSAFPGYQGDIFAAEHGSWNKSKRVGYELIRVPLKNGKATGEYEDFMTGFVVDDGNVWGRPVGVVAGDDGTLFVTDDGYKAIWHITRAK